jgi:hypothetical protein
MSFVSIRVVAAALATSTCRLAASAAGGRRCVARVTVDATRASGSVPSQKRKSCSNGGSCMMTNALQARTDNESQRE